MPFSRFLQGHGLISLIVLTLAAATPSIAKPFSAPSFVPALYRRGTNINSPNVSYPFPRDLYWNTNQSVPDSRVLPPVSEQKRDLLGLDDLDIWVLGGSHLNEFSGCASAHEDSDVSRGNCAGSASSAQLVLQSVSDSLRPMAAKYGHANYDRNSAVETVLKETIDYIKKLLHSLAVAIDKDCLLGPLLGPIVYQIKCIIDELLNGIENISDGCLNDLKALLKLCACENEIGGLCLDLFTTGLLGGKGL
ncbi:hypothetical protein AAF712_000906 [Marasmius tenuissimus]|uniref:Uncharacterized protein n=1 Tax=Marasmius tenuissimus TaxID=585030 RepID=A0ABR3AE29_9AGAR|nr:hypothetical protein PM082_002781 [Marasmius tenuissimus]